MKQAAPEERLRAMLRAAAETPARLEEAAGRRPPNDAATASTVARAADQEQADAARLSRVTPRTGATLPVVRDLPEETARFRHWRRASLEAARRGDPATAAEWAEGLAARDAARLAELA